MVSSCCLHGVYMMSSWCSHGVCMVLEREKKSLSLSVQQLFHYNQLDDSSFSSHSVTAVMQLMLLCSISKLCYCRLKAQILLSYSLSLSERMQDAHFCSISKLYCNRLEAQILLGSSFIMLNLMCYPLFLLNQ